MNEFLKRTWAEIDLNAIGENFQNIKSTLKPGVKTCCVIKADAYGHGAVVLAKEYEALGADWFAVSNIEEALQLRQNGITGTPILILGYTPPTLAGVLAEHHISQTVLSYQYACELSSYAQKCGEDVKIHIKVDTGMSRIGFVLHEPDPQNPVIREMELACRLPRLLPEGIFTHFAAADEGEDGAAFSEKQFACFTCAVKALEKKGIRFELRHCANSAAVADYPEFQLDMVRMGIILYGLQPSGQIQHRIPLRPAMELKSVISLLKDLQPGNSISYGRIYTTDKVTRIATVPIGYADGYPRRFSNKAYMLVHGKPAPIVGRVCMDQLMLDVSGIMEAKEGDTVTVFGRDGERFLPVDELAKLNDTIHYEMVCLVGKRVPRVYMRNGKPCVVLNVLTSSLPEGFE